MELPGRVPGAEASVPAACWLHHLYPPDGGSPGGGGAEWLGALRPDRLAERLVVTQLTAPTELAGRCPAGLEERQALRAITAGLEERQALRAITLLGRAAADQQEAAGPASRTASSSPGWTGVSLQRAQAGPLEASACFPPTASARRHRFAGILDTRKRFAISRSQAPSLISSAAASRTRSRRARSAAVSPLPSGYLMVPA